MSPVTSAPGGYAGKVLIVDVTRVDATTLPLDEAVFRAAGVRVLPAGRHPADDQRQVRGTAGGARLAAMQPGGASSNFLTPDQLDVPLDFDTLAAAGSTLVLRFFRDASCGKCVPCRVGSTKAHILLASALASGDLDDDGAAQLVELEYAMRKTSICGLGQVALGPVISVLRQQAP
jgi:NADH:ubiquinone oxidoreductase subunit F (NADH-binding)